MARITLNILILCILVLGACSSGVGDDEQNCEIFAPQLDESMLSPCFYCYWGVADMHAWVSRGDVDAKCQTSVDCARHLPFLQNCLDRECLTDDVVVCMQARSPWFGGCRPVVYEDGTLGWTGDCPMNGGRMLCVNNDDAPDNCSMTQFCGGCYFSSATMEMQSQHTEYGRPSLLHHQALDANYFRSIQYFPAGNISKLWPYGGAYAFPVGVNEPICADLDCRICTPVDPCPDGQTCAARHRGAATAMAYDEENYLIGYCVKDENVGCLDLEDCPGDPFCKGQYCGISWREGDDGREAYSTCKTHGYDPDYYTCQLLDLYPDLVNEHVVVCDGSPAANAKPECVE